MNLQDIPKDKLIEITRRLHGSVGDTGRNNKEYYVNLLTSQYHDAALVEAQQITTATPARNDDALAVIGNAAAGADAVASIIAGLKLLIPPAGVQRGEVESIVRDVIESDEENTKREISDYVSSCVQEQVAELAGKMKPVVQRIVVTAKGEHTVPEVVHPLFDDVLALAGLRQNILLCGPAGVGKTTLAHQVATALGLEYGAISCSGGMSESQLGGWLLPVADNGKFVYVPAKFVELYENGGVFLMDEIDAMDGNVGVFINAALANGGFFVQNRIGNQWCKRHADFVCIAAANTFGHGGDMVYAGRERLDGATLDRFRSATLYMGYDKAMEEKLVDAEVLEWGLAIRTKIEELKLRRVMSTRVMVAFSEQKANLDWGVEKWERSYFADWTKDELRKIGRTA